MKEDIKNEINSLNNETNSSNPEQDKSTVHVEQEMLKTTTSIFKFSRFATEFSKWVSLIMILCWIINLILGWISFYLTGNYPLDVLEYVKEPVSVVLGFYYSTKMVENVSKGVCAYLNKKLNIKIETDNTNTYNDVESYTNLNDNDSYMN